MNYTGYTMTESVRSFMYKVYGWMAAGLALTAGTAYYVFTNKALFNYIFSSPWVIGLLVIAQFGAVIALSGFVLRMQLSTAIVTFVGYSILTGVTLSSIFFVYQISSIYLVFAVAAGMFATMAIYGYFTKSDLTGVGSLARMGLFGIIIAIIINIFARSAQMDYIISLIGVGVFTLLIAYDSQKIKQMGQMMLGQGQVANKVALLGALTLYLDFINLFIFLLNLLGKKRD
ncbi:MAG: Bax inhibitor-1/YccA family protein [Candidatus Babeliales bacterium]